MMNFGHFGHPFILRPVQTHKTNGLKIKKDGEIIAALFCDFLRIRSLVPIKRVGDLLGILDSTVHVNVTVSTVI